MLDEEEDKEQYKAPAPSIPTGENFDIQTCLSVNDERSGTPDKEFQKQTTNGEAEAYQSQHSREQRQADLDAGTTIRTLEGDEAGDELAQDAMNYHSLLAKIDGLLDELKLDA